MQLPDFVGVDVRFFEEPEIRTLTDIFCPLFYIPRPITDEIVYRPCGVYCEFDYQFNELKIVRLRSRAYTFLTRCHIDFIKKVDAGGQIQYTVSYRFDHNEHILINRYDFDTDLIDLALRDFQRVTELIIKVLNSPSAILLE
jgi:hypothetical protein